MTEILLVCTALFAGACLVLLIVLMRRKPPELANFDSHFAALERAAERGERTTRDELACNREEATNGARHLREELSKALEQVTNTLAGRLAEGTQSQKGQLDSFAQQLAGLTQTSIERLDTMRGTVETKLTDMMIASGQQQALAREEAGKSLNGFCELLLGRMTEVANLQKNQLDTFSIQLQTLTESNGKQLELLRETVERRLLALQNEAAQHHAHSREELAKNMTAFGLMLAARVTEIATAQKTQLEQFQTNVQALATTTEQKLEQMRMTVEGKLTLLQADNAAKLEQMRVTVDEKLHATLELRLGESFKIVSERLELVHKGLGEMRSLANGVGDLKKVLTNIKTRGNWGEVQLGNLLEQMLTPDQYAGNVQVNPASRERVEFAIKLPGRDNNGHPCWLPIDAKFPQEDYLRLVDAAEIGDAAQLAISASALEARIFAEAKKIKEKYIHVPNTTDFAILFLPTEGLFAEILRRPGLFEGILHDHRVVLAGPTTLAAVLSSLQMGFRTLAIEKHSSEVSQVLGAVKTEFGKFGDVLEKVQKKLQEASHTIDSATTRSRVLEGKLKGVQELSAEDVEAVLGVIDATPIGIPANSLQ